MEKGTKIRRVIKTQQARQGAFLAAFAECGSVTRAAGTAGVRLGDHHRWLNEEDGYREAFREAEEEAVERLEEEARRRAVEGTEKPVFYQGEQVGVVRDYSDTLLMFLLKAARPERYRDRAAQEADGENGGPLRIIIDGDLDGDIYGAHKGNV